MARIEQVPCRRGWPVVMKTTALMGRRMREQRTESKGQARNLRIPYANVKVCVIFDYKRRFVIRGEEAVCL